MSYVDSLWSERRYRQAKFLNRIKVCDSSLSTTEKKYHQILTQYAFTAIQHEYNRADQSEVAADTSSNQCHCSFFRGMRLPCRHIFKYLTQNEENTFIPELIADGQTLQYNCTLNINQRSTVTATMGTPVRQPSTLTTIQKFRKGTGKLQKLASLIAQEGMSVYREQMAVIDQLIDFWQEGKRCTLVETVELQVDDSDEGDVQEKSWGN